MKLILLKTLLQKSEQGMTLMETLVAIFMMGIMVAVSTPPLILGMATRIQTRRAEAAMDIAQKEIERIRLIVDRGEYVNTDLPPEGQDSGGNAIANPNQITKVAPPTTILANQPCGVPPQPSCSNPTYQEAWWTETEDFFVQTFREPGVQQNGQIVVFRMGVRVYSKVAVEELGQLETDISPLYLTKGAGEKVSIIKNGHAITAKQRQFPLAVVYGDFSRGDLVGSLERYREFIQ